MRVLGKAELARLRELLSTRRPESSAWELKLFNGNIIISIPVDPWNSETRKPDPSRRYLAKHWRIVPEPGGPFQLEYMRHTEQWWPFFGVVGDLEQMADFIATDAHRLDYTGSEES